jgi:FkbM family methyltransferase
MLKKVLIGGVALGIVGAVVMAVPALRGPVIKTVIWATGNGGGCSLQQCLDEIDWKLSILADGLLAKSSLLEKNTGLEHWRTPYGDFWTPPENALFFNLAEQEVDVYNSKEQGGGVRPGNIVLDCGANVGTFTRIALNLGASKVVAFDIDPRNVASLRKTFAPEIEQGRVVVVPEGVWDHKDTLQAKFYRNGNLNTVVMEERPETDEVPEVVSVPLTTIDAVVKELDLPRVDFIKMDVEGAEPNALRGARETISKFKPVMSIATENQAEDMDVIRKLLRGEGWSYSETNGPFRRIRKTVIRPESILFTPR